MRSGPGFSAIGSFLGAALLPLLLLGLLVFLLRARRGRRARAARDTALDLAIAFWILLILAVTVVPVRETGTLPPMGVIPFLDALRRIDLGESSVPEEIVDIVNNIILFIPLGVLAGIRLGRSWAVVFVLLAVCLSTAIELTQAIQEAGRFASTTDVVTNTIGAAIGFSLGVRFRHRNAEVPGLDQTDATEAEGPA